MQSQKIAFTHVHRDPRTPQKKIQIIRKGVLNTKEENRLSGLKILPEIEEDAFPVLPHGDLVRQKMLRKKFKCIANKKSSRSRSINSLVSPQKMASTLV